MERRIIEVRLEYPQRCALSQKNLDILLEVYKAILRAFISDYRVLVQTWKEKIGDPHESMLSY